MNDPRAHAIEAATVAIHDRHCNPHCGESLTTMSAYCVDSGRPVRLIPGDRCLAHGDRDVMCTTALRAPRCQHPHLSPNHPRPHCSECGKDLDDA